MNITVKYYSYLETIFGGESIKIKVGKGTTINSLLTELSHNLDDDTQKAFGNLIILSLVNNNLVKFDYSLKKGDIISLLVPMGGG